MLSLVGAVVGGPNRLRLGCIFAPSRIEAFRSTTFLVAEERGMGRLIPRQTGAYEFACSPSLLRSAVDSAA